MITLNLCISKPFLILFLWNFCDCLSVSHDTKSDLTTQKIVKYSWLQLVHSIQPIKNGDFASFREKLRSEIPGVTDQMLNSREKRDLFNNKIENKFDFKVGKKDDKVVPVLLSMICSSCKGDCKCLQNLECTVPCSLDFLEMVKNVQLAKDNL